MPVLALNIHSLTFFTSLLTLTWSMIRRGDLPNAVDGVGTELARIESLARRQSDLCEARDDRGLKVCLDIAQRLRRTHARPA
jgi:hypothetical protein